MTAQTSGPPAAQEAAPGALAIGSADLLRAIAIAAGVSSALLFVVVGTVYELQMYADGSMFSYAVAVADAWALHWHNISGRLFVYLYSLLPAQTYVELTRDARGGIVLYGLLFFAAQLLGLLATFAADRSSGRILFAYACASTACLCPLVFGFPTEMWIAHALFWPTLAACHYARRRAIVFAALLALILTHEAALVLALAILATLALRGFRDPRLLRATGALVLALAVWAAVKATLRADDYFGPVLTRAALSFFDLNELASDLLLLLLAALVAYGLAVLVLRRFTGAKAPVYAFALVAAALVVHWLWFDRALHTESRYYLRTALLIATPVFGALAAAYALRADHRLAFPFLLRPLAALAGGATAQAAAGALLLVMLVHAVETAKFVAAWSDYKAAVRGLAMGTASDPALGDARFVSSERIGAALNRLAWFSTTPFLSVLVAPGFAPARLVIDPHGNYFWFSCATATANAAADRAVPAETRRLVRDYTCLHR